MKTLLSKSVYAGLGAMALGLCAALPLTITSQTASAQTSSDDLARAAEALRAISTMQADFTQTDRQGRTIGGKLTLKRPGKIRFAYEEAAQLLVVSNGKSLYLVDYEVDQVQRWPIKNSPLGALLDPERDVRQYGELKPTGNPNVISIEVRDPKRPEFGVINLIFQSRSGAPGGLELSHWVALDSQNHRTTVRLSNHRYGIAVNDRVFRFKDPRRSSRRPG
jgi:outer membrane lipoprotein-sorting protein